jgi:holo-[acyl-carrier protein] synthase
MTIVGVGTDLVELDRFRHTLERTPGVARRVFTDAERAYCDDRSDPTERYAVRFAAKEAVLKALTRGVFSLPLSEIEVVRDEESGAPSLRLHGKAAAAAAEAGVVDWRLTLTHTEHFAQATAIALGEPDAPSLRFEVFATDLDRSISFYETVLGFVCERRDGDVYAHLRLGGIELGVLAVAALPDDHPTRPVSGVPHGTGVELVVEVPDLHAAHARAKAKLGRLDDPQTQPWGLTDFRVTDPDGVYIRVTNRY